MIKDEEFLNGRVVLYGGDCREILKQLPDNSIDAVTTDPPYALVSIGKRLGKDGAAHATPKEGKDGAYARASAGFMGKQWDTGETAFAVEFWEECFRVLKPGGHVVAFSGTRTYHRLAVAIEDAGFEIRDQLAWVYGSGFPKSHNVSKAIDKAAGAEREVIGKGASGKNSLMGGLAGTSGESGHDITSPATDEARKWDGWGTALKPAWEPICLARKPLIGNVVENVLEHGTGAINIDGCRVIIDETEIVQDDGQRVTTTAHEGYLRPGASMFNTGKAAKRSGPSNSQGRFPANLIHDGSDEVVSAFPGEGDKSAARFFYSAKASKHDRAGSKHPTVKPVALMQWLIRLVCPKGGTIIDPFSGSGTTGSAAYLEGVNAILCEREDEYLSDIRSRLNALDTTDKKSEPGLFD